MKKVLVISIIFLILVFSCKTMNHPNQADMKISENDLGYSNLTGETIFIFTQEDGAPDILESLFSLKPDTEWVISAQYNSDGYGNNLLLNTKGDDDLDFYLPFHNSDSQFRVDGLHGTMNDSMRFGHFKTENINQMITRLPEILRFYNDSIMQFQIIKKQTEPQSQFWYSDSEKSKIIITGKNILAQNLSNSEEKVLIEYDADWLSLDNGGFKLTLNFIDKTGGDIERFNFFTHFPEKRNNEYGGGTGRTLNVGSGHMSVYFEDLQPRYPVETFIIKEVQIQFSDKMIQSYPEDLDKRI